MANSYWIGLRREDNEFVWSDGRSLQENVAPWNREEPTFRVGEECVIMGHPCCEMSTYTWFDVPCDEEFFRPSNPGYICQRRSGEFSNFHCTCKIRQSV